MKRMIGLTVLFPFFLFSGGCSVYMAMKGKKDPNLSVVKVGVPKQEIEMELGSPTQTTSLDNGARVCIYDYEIGNEPSPGRAAGHAVLDILTIGLWEIVGTPIEGYTGTKYTIKITYDKDDKVLSFANQKTN